MRVGEASNLEFQGAFTQHSHSAQTVTLASPSELHRVPRRPAYRALRKWLARARVVPEHVMEFNS